MCMHNKNILRISEAQNCSFLKNIEVTQIFNILIKKECTTVATKREDPKLKKLTWYFVTDEVPSMNESKEIFTDPL